MSVDGSGGEQNATESEPSETLLESLLATLDADETREPWYRQVENTPTLDDDGSAAAIRWLRALADAKREGRAGRDEGSTTTATADTDCPVLAVLDAAHPFDDLAHLGPALDRRLGTIRRARVVDGGSTHRVDVRALARPDSETPTDAFEASLADQLDRWRAVGDIEGVVPVFDSGTRERPWVATASVGSTVWNREDSLGLSLFHACRLTDALATLHDRGVVHAGIDPGNVVYPITDDGERPAPAFHNVGLADVYRRHTDPARVLDPRYAAPEYFDQADGIVDRTTDIYQLGTLLYTLLTGDPPVEGSPAEIRETVLAGDLPSIAAHDQRLPDELDEILGRATATDSFDRYDTAHDFHRDLTALCERLLE